MANDDPYELAETDGSFVTTLKQGKGYEDPWLVIRGSTAAELKARIIAAFGYGDDANEVSLVGVIHNAAMDFQAMGTVGRGLGGRVVSRAQAATSGDDPWVGAAAAVAEAEEATVDPNKRLLDEISSATSTDQLKRFWVENNSQFNDVVDAAWRAKGKALKGGND